MNSTYLGYLYTVLSAAAFASMSLFLKLALATGMSVWGFSLINSAFTLILLGVMMLRQPPAGLPRKPLSWPWAILFAICGAAAAIAFNVSLVHLSISLSTILLFTYPAFVALGAWALLGQRPSYAHVQALLLTVVGAVLTANVTEALGGTLSMVGITLALVAALTHAMYIVVGERLTGALAAVPATTLTRAAILGGTILLAPGVFAEVPSVTWQGWLVCLVSSAVAGVVPFLFLNRGIALIGANRAAIASVAELPFALALGMLFQGDVILPLQWIGAALIVIAVVISQRQQTPEGETPHGSGTGAT